MRKPFNLLVLLLPLVLFGWVRYFPPSYGYQMFGSAIDATIDGDVLTTTIDVGTNDSLVIYRLSPIGETEWSWTVDGVDPDFIPKIALYPSGALQLLYVSTGYAEHPLRLSKYAAPETLIWENFYSESDPSPVILPLCIDVDDDGSCVAGGIKVNTEGVVDIGRIWVARLDDYGGYDMESELLDAHNIDDTLTAGVSLLSADSETFVEGIYLTDMGDVLVHGILINYSGDTIWTWTNTEWLPFPIMPEHFFTAYSDGHYILGLASSGWSARCYIFCLSSSGSLLWSKEFTSPPAGGDSIIVNSAVGVDDGFVLVGKKYISESESYAWAGKISLDGSFVWQRKYYPNALLTDVVSFPDNGFAACGTVGDELIVLRADATGDTSFSDISEAEDKCPQDLKVSAAPNPFNRGCTITIEGAHIDNATLRIFDCLGKLVCPEKPISEKYRSITWTPDESIPGGVYFIYVRTPSRSSAEKVLFVK